MPGPSRATPFHTQSPIATAGTALIARATDGSSSIAWETQAVPEAASKDTVVVHLACRPGEQYRGEAVSPLGEREGRRQHSPLRPLRSGRSAGAGGIRLHVPDGDGRPHRDRFGFMRLCLPPGMATPGKPVALRITGEAAKSSAWVMTFTIPARRGRHGLITASDHAGQREISPAAGSGDRQPWQCHDGPSDGTRTCRQKRSTSLSGLPATRYTSRR